MMTATDEDLEKEVSAMRAKDLRKELESYGISTKSFFEKGELVDALVKARLEGKTPISNGAANGEDAAFSADADGASDSSSASSAGTASRAERIQQEMEKCKTLKVKELKTELESYGVSTKSYFEKSEFVRAVAEARVDGPKASGAGTSSGRSAQQQDEPYDPSYRDVFVKPFNAGENVGLLGGLIDVRPRYA